MKILPIGDKLLVLPRQKENHSTESGLEIVNLVLMEAEVVEVSNHLKDVYTKGDIVLIPQQTGTQHFCNGKPHLFINGREINGGGDVWAIVSNDIIPQDKGDEL